MSNGILRLHLVHILLHAVGKTRNFNVYFFAVLHTPIFPHVVEAWEKREHPNLMFLFYEDMQNVSSCLKEEWESHSKA